MAHYILHIGYGKTGTTALQRFLAANRDALKARSILYPDARVNGSWLGANDHNMVARALAGRMGWWNLMPEDYLQQFEEQRQDAGAETVILSGESFMGFLQPWKFEDAHVYWQALEDMAARVSALLKGHEVTVVVYLRRQDEWMDSAINQTIKYGALLDDGSAAWSDDKLIEAYAPRLDYGRCLDAWAKAFSADAIKVGVYESERFREGGIVAEFLALCRIDREGLVYPALNSEERNTRLSRDVLEVKRILNKIGRPKYEERVLAARLRDISAAMSDTERDWPLLSKAERETLVDRFAASNADVARRYLGRGDGVLFQAPRPDAGNGDDAYPGLSVEAGLEILMRLDREMSTLSARLQILRHWLAEKLRKHAPALHGVARTLRALFLRILGGKA